MSNLTKKEFDSLKIASRGILEGRRREHAAASGKYKCHAIYIQLTPGSDDASSPEVIVEKTLAESNLLEALFHDQEAKRYERAIADLDETTYEESSGWPSSRCSTC